MLVTNLETKYFDSQKTLVANINEQFRNNS